MGWRSIIISQPAHLTIHNKQLVIKQEEEHTVPLEDISAIVLESDQTTLTSYLLREISKEGIVLFTCDEKHIPCGALYSFHQHSRQNKITRSQIDMKQPFAKRCWQKIIQRKILNQSHCLQYLVDTVESSRRDDLIKHSKELLAISKQVDSGDTSNRESWASRVYFSKLLDGKTRNTEFALNGALNYGYAIFRGALARTLAVYGFIPSLGIHHDNELNSFNLADDFLELYRPLVDLWAMSHIPFDKTELEKEHRIALVSLLHYDLELDGEKHTALRTMESVIGSFSTALLENNYNKLLLPELIPLQQHDYEQ